MEEKKQPEKKFVAGPVSAAVWVNKTQSGDGVFRTVTVQRGYKDKNNEWQNTQSLRVNDIPKAVLVLTKAYEYLAMQGEDE